MTVASCSDDYAQPPMEIPGGWDKIGGGSWENPLQVWQANSGSTVDGREANWVCGYIVGSINRDYPTYSEQSADFGVPTTNYNTIILAQAPLRQGRMGAAGVYLGRLRARAAAVRISAQGALTRP